MHRCATTSSGLPSGTATDIGRLADTPESEYVFRSRDGSLWIRLADGTERLATVRETLDYPTDDPQALPAE